MGKTKRDFQELIHTLIKGNEKRIIKQNVKQIKQSSKMLILDDFSSLLYSKLITTLNYNLFNTLCLKRVFNGVFSDVYFYHVKLKNEKLKNEIKKHEFVYFIDNKYPFYRLTRINKDEFVLESKSEIDYLNDFGILDKKLLVNSKIVKNLNIKDNIRTLFVGRYSQVNSEIKIHNVIDRILELKCQN